MNYLQETRAKARAAIGATAVCALATLSFTGAYLAGGEARADEGDASTTRLVGSVQSTGGSTGSGAPGSTALSSLPGTYVVGRAAANEGRASSSTGLDAALSTLRDAFSGGYRTPDANPFQGVPLAANVSARELDCLTQAVYYEARGEGQSGMEAVAQVVVNRVRHPDFPNTICGVVYQGVSRGRGCQFSFVCDGSMRRRSEAELWDRSRSVAVRAIEGRLDSPVGTSTFFHATRIAPNWRGLQRMATIGRHVFYRHAGARGLAGNLLRSPFAGAYRVGGSDDRAQDRAVTVVKPRAYAVAESPARTSGGAPRVQASYRPAPAPAPAVAMTYTPDPLERAAYATSSEAPAEAPAAYATVVSAGVQASYTAAPADPAASWTPDATISADSAPVQTISLDSIVEAIATAS